MAVNKTGAKLAAAIIALGVVGGAAAYWSPSAKLKRQNAWLNSLSIADLERQDVLPDAPFSTHFLTLKRLCAENQFSEALSRARGVVRELKPDDASVPAANYLALAAVAAAEQGDAEASETWRKRAALTVPANPDLEVAAGFIARLNGDLEEAYTHFIASAGHRQDAGFAYRQAGLAALNAHLDAEAADALSKAAPGLQNEESAQVYAALSEALHRLGNETDAAVAAHRAVALAPNNGEIKSLPARLQAASAVSEAEFAAADAALQGAMQQQPDDPRLIMLLAGLHYRFADLSGAADLVKRYLQLAPQDRTAWLLLHDYLQHTQKPDAAQLAEAQKQFEAINDGEAAVFRLQIACQMEPKNADLMLGFSKALHHVGRDQEAYRALTAAAKLAPGRKDIQSLMQGAGRMLQQRQSSAGNGAGQ